MTKKQEKSKWNEAIGKYMVEMYAKNPFMPMTFAMSECSEKLGLAKEFFKKK